MVIHREGVIGNVRVKSGRSLNIDVIYPAESGESTLIIGIKFVKKIVKKVGETEEAVKSGLIGKKFEVIVE